MREDTRRPDLVCFEDPPCSLQIDGGLRSEKIIDLRLGQKIILSLYRRPAVP